MKNLRVRPVLFTVMKVSTSLAALKKSHRMVLKENAINQEVDGNGVAVAILADRHLEGHPLLELKVRNELLKQLGAYSLGARAKLYRIW